jgi:hypothetical protein
MSCGPRFAAGRTAPERHATAARLDEFANRSGGITMCQVRHFAKPATVAGLAVSALLGFAGITFSTEPAGAVVYCQYIDYPPSCVARPGVVLRPRPVARAAVRATTVTPRNINGGVNRVGIR